MKKTITTTYTDSEFRQLIREELKAVLNNEVDAIAVSNEEGYINMDQAVEYLKLQKSTLYNKVHKKDIPFHKSGKRVLFKKSELASWLIDQEKNSFELNEKEFKKEAVLLLSERKNHDKINAKKKFQTELDEIKELEKRLNELRNKPNI